MTAIPLGHCSGQCGYPTEYFVRDAPDVLLCRAGALAVGIHNCKRLPSVPAPTAGDQTGSSSSGPTGRLPRASERATA